MLIVSGEFRMQPGTRASFFEAVAPLVEATVAETGCVTYAFTPDPNDDDLIRLYEVWESQEALDAHFVTPHMLAWRERSAGLAIASRTVSVYEAQLVRTL